MAAFFAVVAQSAFAHVPVVYVTTPEADWCGVIEQSLGGDIIMLSPGVYTGPCAIVGKVSDPIGENTTVQSLDPTDPAVLVAGTGDHVLSVSGVRVVLFELAFAGLPPGVDAVHVGDGDDIWVRYSDFDDIGGAAVRQVGPLGDAIVENNTFAAVMELATFGCQGGCTLGSLLVEDNFAESLGTGITVQAQSVATVRNNVLFSVTGAGVQTGSSCDATLDGNLIESETVAVELQEGPALVRSQILVATFGIRSLSDADVRIVGNTIVSSGGFPLELVGWGADAGFRLADNAIDGPLPDTAGADATGNVSCVPADLCFTDASAWDFYPPPGSLLRGAGTVDGELLSDWCGKPRQDPPTPGAFEAFGDVSYGAVPRTAKTAATCTEVAPPPPGPEDTDTDAPLPAAPEPDVVATSDEASCGCSESTAGAAWAAMLAAAMVIRTRGRRSALRTARSDPPSR